MNGICQSKRGKRNDPRKGLSCADALWQEEAQFFEELGVKASVVGAEMGKMRLQA